MLFHDFTKSLKRELKKPLPGVNAQLKLTPYDRRSRLDAFNNNPNPKLSAVLALIYQKKEAPHILLTLRNSYKGVHSNQVSFPGGKREKLDLDFQATALRETEEETGITNQNIEIITNLTTVYIPPSQFLVHPFLAITNHELIFQKDDREVNLIIECPITELLDDESIGETTIQNIQKGIDYKTPCLTLQNNTVWGATAMILSEIKEIIKPIFL